jgi:AcrR family transcriptional regulator
VTRTSITTRTAGSETREGVLRVALRAFAVKGFDGTSTREIAAGAGVNHGLIRHHFGSKQKLWQAAVDLAFQDMQADLDALLHDPTLGDDRERIARIIRAHVHYVAHHPEFVRLMLEEGKRRGPRMRWIADRHVKPLYAAIGTLLESGGTRGTLPAGISPVHFFYALAGAVGLLFHQAEECRRVAGVDPFEPEVIEEHARVVEQLFLGPTGDGGR